MNLESFNEYPENMRDNAMTKIITISVIRKT